jgi:hypothetical protein
MRLTTSGETSCETNFVLGPVNLQIMEFEPVIAKEDVHFCKVQYGKMYKLLVIANSNLYLHEIGDLS